mgnify:FL=1
MKFLENSYEKITDLKGFDIIDSLKKRFEAVSKEFIEKLEDEIVFEESEEIIKLIQPKNIALKRCFIDELGFSIIMPNGFEPKYNYYIKDNQIIVKVEIPGNFNLESNLSNFEHSNEYTIIKLSGTKNQDDEPIKIEDNILDRKSVV